jgi:hypothetical protein
MATRPAAFTIDQAKSSFLEVEKIQKAAERANYRSLARFGAFVRADARDRIRRRKSSAKPGQGPTNWNGSLKRFIYYAPDLGDQNVLIGPARLSGKPETDGQTVPELLEYGGQVRQKITRVFLGRLYRARHENRDAASAFRALKPKVGQVVTFDYEPRPFMGPAFAENEGKVGDIWADSIR